MKFEINLDELVEIRAKLGNPRFTDGREEYRTVLQQKVQPFEGLGRPIRGGMVEVIFKFDISEDKWDVFIST